MAEPLVPMDDLDFCNTMIAHLQNCLLQTAEGGYIDISKGNERVKLVTVEQATKNLQHYKTQKLTLEGVTPYGGGAYGC